jgi:hypothetical protein
MNFKKIVASALAAATFLGMAAPTFAMLGVGDIYEGVPVDGVRLIVSDDDNELLPLYIDVGVNEDKSTYVLGKLPVYGNDEDDYDGKYSYSTIGLEINRPKEDVSEFGYAIYDSAAKAYNVYLLKRTDVLTGDAYKNTVANLNGQKNFRVRQEFLQSDLEDLFDEAIRGEMGGVDAFWAAAPTDPITITDDLFLAGPVFVGEEQYLQTGISSNNTRIHKGEADQIADFLDEVYVYWKTDENDEYYVSTGLEFSDAAHQDSKVEAPRNLNARGYGIRGTATFEYPENPAGVVGFQVDLDDGGGVQLTHQTVLFYATDVGDDHDIEIASLNMEGEESTLLKKSVETQDDEIATYLKDIDDAPNFRDFIHYGYKLAMWDGFSDGTFRPDTDVSRQALAAFVYRAFRGDIAYNVLSTPDQEFPDVQAGANQFYPFIKSLQNAGIVRGFSDGEFKPEDPVTRDAGVTYIYNAIKSVDKDAVREAATNCFSDTAGNSHAGRICGITRLPTGNNYIKAIAGYSNGTFQPATVMNRAQMATFLLKAVALIDIGGGDTILEIGVDEGMAATYGANTLYVLSSDANYPFLFQRPFMPTIAVESLKSYESMTTAIGLEWKNLAIEDDSVDGYIVERREEGQEKWEEVEGEYGAGITTTTITVAGDADANIDGKITVNGSDIRFKVDDGTLEADIVNTLSQAINKVAGMKTSVAGSVITVESEVEGAAFTVAIPALIGVNFGSGADLAHTATGVVVAGTTIQFGYIPAIEFDAADAVVRVTDLDVDDGKTYEYRVRATKWVPFMYADSDDYADMADMLADSDGVEEIVANSVVSQEATVEVVAPAEKEVSKN